jgi:hypothetical protein
MSTAERRLIYEHFNAHETVGTVVASALAAAEVPEAGRSRVGGALCPDDMLAATT